MLRNRRKEAAHKRNRCQLAHLGVLLLLAVASGVLSGCASVNGYNNPPGGTQLSVSGTAAGNITTTTAQISWQSNVPATSQVSYGTASSYGAATTLDTAMVTSHQQTLNGLKAGTTYHFRVISTAKNDTASSNDQTFTTTAAADTVPPTVSITAPANGATVSATVSVTANASDNVGVASVQFQVDSANAGALQTAAPYSYSWDTTKVSNGSHSLKAIAKDAAGNNATSAVTVTVNNSTSDTTPPTISITAPADGATVSATVNVTATASDNVGVASVQFQVDSANTGALQTTAPYSYSWDTTKVSNGSHSVQAIAKDAAGNSTTSTAVTVTVNNSSSGGAPTVPPAQICGNSSLLSGPATPPAGAVTVPAGDNSSFDFGADATTYWFASGVHTLGTDQFGQIIPGNNSAFIGAPGAILDGQGLNRYAFTQHATGVTIKYLTVRNFVSPTDEGVVNHDSGVGWTIQYNTITKNKGAGLFLGTNNVGSYNCLADNGQYGFQVIGSDTKANNVTLDHNEISGNNAGDLEHKIPGGCGCTGGGKFWEAQNVTVTNNYVHDNKSVGLWADTNDVGFHVEGNYIANNDSVGFFYEISYNALIKNNTFLRNGIVEGPQNDGFPTGAIYLSESGGDSRVANTNGYSKIEVTGNVFTDNWAGVVLWENADRFCNSPSNTSGGTCTLVNPAVVNLNTCVAGTINNPPYFSDCRWKTQNVSVHDNVFNMNKANIPGCTASPFACGLQGIFSNDGTFPSWSPYMGFVVADAIVSTQNNVFANNQYTGDWHFMVHDQGIVIDFAAWQAAPYKQDAGSTLQ